MACALHQQAWHRGIATVHRCTLRLDTARRRPIVSALVRIGQLATGKPSSTCIRSVTQMPNIYYPYCAVGTHIALRLLSHRSYCTVMTVGSRTLFSECPRITLASLILRCGAHTMLSDCPRITLASLCGSHPLTALLLNALVTGLYWSDNPQQRRCSGSTSQHTLLATSLGNARVCAVSGILTLMWLSGTSLCAAAVQQQVHKEVGG